ncbi:MAG: DUF559 domain-containing protein [Oscillospiraceae bacterium]|nr:DUF559 domain-containing protein [Oscillospiraceae bacterium]
MTKEEKHLWYDFLKGYHVPFLRQKVIDDYIADFYCHKARLVIELDGSQHYTEYGLLKDEIRTEKIEKRDLTVLRIPNGEINHNFEGICRFIDEFVKESLRQPSADTQLLRCPKYSAAFALEYFDRGAKPCSLYRPLGALRKLCSLGKGGFEERRTRK